MVLDSTMNHVKVEIIEEPEVEEVIIEKPIVEETTEEATNEKENDLFKLLKSEQIEKLKDLGLSKSEIKQLKSEIERVNKIIELDR